VLFEILCSYDHAGADGTRKGWCNPSLDKVAEQMGLKKRAVQTHLKRLVEAGMVFVVYRNNQQFDGRTSLYILNILPGLNEVDLKRIAHTRNIEIKHMLSGLNTIKVQTAKGIFDVAEEQFDLEFIITGKRSSTILQADDIASAEDIISSAEEGQIKDKELYGFTGDQLKANKNEVNSDDDMSGLSYSDRKVKKKSQGPGWNSEDMLERIKSGNYKDITSSEICVYFKYLYDKQYPRYPYIIEWNNNKDVDTIRAKLEKFDIDVFIPMMEHFFKIYDKMFYAPEYPRPGIWQFNQSWIVNKLSADFDKTQVIDEKIETVEEKPNIKSKKTVIV
jgi:DNA-binding transcriptional ArsR family regulator